MSKVVLSKSIPTLPAFYYWTPKRRSDIVIVAVNIDSYGRPYIMRKFLWFKVRRYIVDMGGYWGHVDFKYFEIEQ